MQWCEVPGADWAAGLVHQNGSAELKDWNSQTWDITLKYVKANLQYIDIFLCYLYPQQINMPAIAEIKRLGIPCINFYCDNVRQFTKVPKEFKAFDLVWVPEHEALEMYKQEGVNFINLPMPMWVDEKYRNALAPEVGPEISFIGTKDILRENLLGQAINKGLNISVRGAGWIPETIVSAPAQNSIKQKIVNQLNFIKQHGIKSYAIKNLHAVQKPQRFLVDDTHILPKPDFEAYVAITQGSSITLGINRVPTFKALNTQPLIYSRLRDIEAPMLGACYLTEYCKGLNLLYDLDNEVCTYKTVDELIHKARMLLNDKKKRDTMRLKARKKALEEHSIPASLQKLKAAIFK
nr:glycosyltransferase [uncultured Mucilaginibacter sp.]